MSKKIKNIFDFGVSLKKIKFLLSLLFPVPDKALENTDGNFESEKMYFFKKLLFRSLFFLSYLMLAKDIKIIFSKKNIFQSVIDFLVFNNYIESVASLFSLIIAIAMMHFMLHLQKEAPKELGERFLFNTFITALFFIGLNFKSNHIDPLIGEVIFNNYKNSISESFLGKADGKLLDYLKIKLSNGKLENNEASFELLCELGHIDGCYNLSDTHSEKLNSKYYWSLKRILDLRPEEAKALNNLSWSLLTDRKLKRTENDLQNALNYAQQAVELNPESHLYNDTLALAHYKLKDCERAKTYQFLAIKYLDYDIERSPSSVLEDEYEKRMKIYEECKINEEEP